MATRRLRTIQKIKLGPVRRTSGVVLAEERLQPAAHVYGVHKLFMPCGRALRGLTPGPGSGYPRNYGEITTRSI